MLDPGVLVSAFITPRGPVGQLIDAIRTGRIRPITCPHLVDVLSGVLHREKFRRYISIEEADQAVDILAESADSHANPTDVQPRCRDPKDDYLIALANDAEADALVSGDQDLVTLADALPVAVLTPRMLFDKLAAATLDAGPSTSATPTPPAEPQAAPTDRR